MKNSALSVSHKINEHQHINSLLGWGIAWFIAGDLRSKEARLAAFLALC